MQSNNRFQAIILAAGTGSRLGALTKNTPKPLLKVNNLPLIAYVIDFVKKAGADEVTVVGGYLFEQLKAAIEKIDPKVKIIENKEYQYQNLISFKKGIENSNENDILVCDADYIFKDHTPKNIKYHINNNKNVSVFCSYDLSKGTDDVMKVKTNEEKKMKEMSKKLNDFEAVWTGAFFINKENFRHALEAADFLAEKDGENNRVESLFDYFLSKNISVDVANVGKADWFEIDTEEELNKARKELENI